VLGCRITARYSDGGRGPRRLRRARALCPRPCNATITVDGLASYFNMIDHVGGGTGHWAGQVPGPGQNLPPALSRNMKHRLPDSEKELFHFEQHQTTRLFSILPFNPNLVLFWRHTRIGVECFHRRPQ